MLKIGCHVSIAGGVFNAPKNAAALGCETFQIFSRSPQGRNEPILTEEVVAQFKEEMKKYFIDDKVLASLSSSTSTKKRGRGDTSPESGVPLFVVHAPYFINFGSSDNRIYYGSVSTIKRELDRASLLGAKYLMTHLGSTGVGNRRDVIAHLKKGLIKVLEDFENSENITKNQPTQLLLENAAGSGNIIGDSFEELAEIMEPLIKFKTFGGICLDSQHAFASGYDLRDADTVASTFKKFDKIIGLKWLKTMHINDSKVDFSSHKDRHEHLGEGKIGVNGFAAILENLKSKILNLKSGEALPLILETKHDKVIEDIKILKQLRS